MAKVRRSMGERIRRWDYDTESSEDLLADIRALRESVEELRELSAESLKLGNQQVHSLAEAPRKGPGSSPLCISRFWRPLVRHGHACLSSHGSRSLTGKLSSGRASGATSSPLRRMVRDLYVSPAGSR
jgi:hypothetical protein